MKMRPKVFPTISCVLAVLASMPAAQAREHSSKQLVLEDAEGRVIGAVSTWGQSTGPDHPEIVMNIAGYPVGIGAGADASSFNFEPYLVRTTVYFSDSNCSGQAYIEPPLSLQGPVAVAGLNLALYLGDPATLGKQAVASKKGAGGDVCEQIHGELSLMRARLYVVLGSFVPPFKLAFRPVRDEVSD